MAQCLKKVSAVWLIHVGNLYIILHNWTNWDKFRQGKVGCRDVNVGVWKQQSTFSQQTSQHMKYLFIWQQVIVSQSSPRERVVTGSSLWQLVALWLQHILFHNLLKTYWDDTFTTSSKELDQTLTQPFKCTVYSSQIGFKIVFISVGMMDWNDSNWGGSAGFTSNMHVFLQMTKIR